MAQVGDRVQVSSTKVGQAPREGVVTRVSGPLLRVRWSTGEESSLVPGAGSVTILATRRAPSGRKTPAAAKPAKAASPAKASKAARTHAKKKAKKQKKS